MAVEEQKQGITRDSDYFKNTQVYKKVGLSSSSLLFLHSTQHTYRVLLIWLLVMVCLAGQSPSARSKDGTLLGDHQIPMPHSVAGKEKAFNNYFMNEWMNEQIKNYTAQILNNS